MSADQIITCTCGVKVRLPAQPSLQPLRCPKCKTPLPAADPQPVLRTAPVSTGDAVLCPICQTPTSEQQATLTCSGCQQVYHQECWDEIGGCGTYGCSQAPAADKSEQSAQAPLSAWGDTKKCPACGETIKSIALRCRFCGTDFASVDPLSVADLHRQAVTQQENSTLKNLTVVAFIMALSGCLAPVALIFGLAYLLPRRKQLVRCGPLFAIMGYTALALSALYCLLMLGFFLAGSIN